jgi:hypothetical protein
MQASSPKICRRRGRDRKHPLRLQVSPFRPFLEDTAGPADEQAKAVYLQAAVELGRPEPVKLNETVVAGI